MKRSDYSRSETHFTFFMVGLVCMLIYSVVDLESFVLLRYLGNTAYDAQTITFFVRRFNLLIGILTTSLSIFFGASVVCAKWHWMLFISYFISTLYIYMLSNSYVLINKLALIPIFVISLISHGMLVSTIKYIFGGSYVKFDRDSNLSLLILFCGCFTSGLLVKILLRVSGDFTLTDDDDYPSLELFNRLFILFTLISLITAFLLSRLPCEPEDENSDSSSSKTTLKNVIYSRSCYVFYMACVSFSFSPMLNNIILTIINSVSMTEAFSLEYLQFFICLAMTLALYLLISTNVITIYSKGGRTETLYDIICRILRISNEANPDIVVEDHIVEDLVSNEALNIRLFRTPQPWCYLQYGFWTTWENYDCVDHARIFSLLSMKMLISKIRGGEEFVNFPDDCVKYKTLQDYYLEILDAKYILMWIITCFIKQCNDVISSIPYILHYCKSSFECKCKESTCCCPSELFSGNKCVFSVLKNCCSKECSSKCGCFSKCFENLFTNGLCKDICKNMEGFNCFACCRSYFPAYQTFVYGILTTCACEAKKLLEEIGESPDLDDKLKIDKSIELSLTVLEEFILRLFGIMVYARVADEILLLFEQIPKIAFNITKSLICFLCKCKCNSSSECCCVKEGQEQCKCVCLLYCKFIRCICLLHKKQNDVCLVILGYSKQSLASVLPTLSMTRAVSLFSYYFGDYMSAPSMIEKSTCKCSSNSTCPCCKWSTRVDDLLEMMYKGLEFLSEYDGVLSLITFFLSYFKQWKLEDVKSGSQSTADCTCCCKTGHSTCPCTSSAGTSGCKCCICCLCCCDKGGSGTCSCCASSASTKCCICCLCCEKCCSSNTGSCSCTGSASNCCFCSDSCCKNCCTKCCGTNDCCSDCCFCCYAKGIIKSRKDPAADLLKLSENSKKNLELITSTRRTMVLQSIGDYVSKYNAFRDIVKSLNSSFVGLRIFNLYLFLCAIVYLFSIVGNVVPYLRNTSVSPRLTILITSFSCMTAVAIIYSFMYLSDFNRDSSFLVNLAILIGMILCIFWSWATQWLTYRMLLYNKFEHFYSKFRLIYTGSVNIYKPTFQWWFEGFLSFIKTDLSIIYTVLILKSFSENYDPFSFGFTKRLRVNYNYLNVNEYNVDQERSLNQHIITKEEFISGVESLLLNLAFYGKKFGLSQLLDYRSFQYIPNDDYHFLTDLNPYDKLCYSVDLLFSCWRNNVLMSHGCDRLQFLREHALRSLEDMIQDEVKSSNYEHKLLLKLKNYFDFRSLILVDLADNCVNDHVNYGHKLASIQSRVLIGIYKTEYYSRFSKYLKSLESTVENVGQEGSSESGTNEHGQSGEVSEPEPGPSHQPGSAQEGSSGSQHTENENVESSEYKAPDPQLLLRQCREWKNRKLKSCDTVYKGNLVCRSVVTKTADELELMIFNKNNKDPLDTLVTLIRSRDPDEEVSDDIKIAHFLSNVSKSGDSGELYKLKTEISDLILHDTSSHKFFGSILKGYLSVSRNLYYESTMSTYFERNDEVIIGEWIRWQGQHITSTILSVLSKFVAIDTSK